MIMRAYDMRNKPCVKTVELPADKQVKCIVSDCPAFRWAKSVPANTIFNTNNKDDFPSYCGLGGAPVSQAIITKSV
jgi:hypothetical protein